MSAETLRAKIREIPDFPKPGILFYDITTLLKDAAAYREAIGLMMDPYRDEKIDIVVGMESRGFIFSAPMAYELGAGLVGGEPKFDRRTVADAGEERFRQELVGMKSQLRTEGCSQACFHLAEDRRAEQDDEIDLAELVGVVREGKWLVLAVWALVLAVAIAYLLLATPVYRAEAVLQVKEATPSVGSVSDTIQSLLEGTSKADTEIQILQSRTLATQVVEEHLCGAMACLGRGAGEGRV